MQQNILYEFSITVMNCLCVMLCGGGQLDYLKDQSSALFVFCPQFHFTLDLFTARNYETLPNIVPKTLNIQSKYPTHWSLTQKNWLLIIQDSGWYHRNHYVVTQPYEIVPLCTVWWFYSFNNQGNFVNLWTDTFEPHFISHLTS